MSNASLEQWSAVHRERAEVALARWLPAAELASGRLLEAMRYSALGGGKRLRALLAYATAEAIGTTAELADHAAAAVELIHAYSLIHDDFAVYGRRRSAPRQTHQSRGVWRGDGDACGRRHAAAFAFAVLLAAPAAPTGIVAAAHELAEASGAYGMAGRQAIDLANVGKPMTQAALEEMHALKTGAMFEAAVILPALLAEEDETTIAALSAYAQRSAWCFRWSTTCSTPRPTARPSARRLARMPPTTSPPSCR